MNGLDHDMEMPQPPDEPKEQGELRSKDFLYHVKLFKPQFAPMVLSGEKCQTVRPTPKRLPKPGDRISLRMWSGKPYRSKQRILRESIISEVAPVAIADNAIKINGCPCDEEAFAQADGFNTPGDMIEWFNVIHGLPFEGIVIKWHNGKHRPSKLLPGGIFTASEEVQEALYASDLLDRLRQAPSGVYAEMRPQLLIAGNRVFWLIAL